MRAYLEDRMMALKEAYKNSNVEMNRLLIDARYDEVCKIYDYWEDIIKGTSLDLSHSVETINSNEKEQIV